MHGFCLVLQQSFKTTEVYCEKSSVNLTLSISPMQGQGVEESQKRIQFVVYESQKLQLLKQKSCQQQQITIYTNRNLSIIPVAAETVLTNTEKQCTEQKSLISFCSRCALRSEVNNIISTKTNTIKIKQLTSAYVPYNNYTTNSHK